MACSAAYDKTSWIRTWGLQSKKKQITVIKLLSGIFPLLLVVVV